MKQKLNSSKKGKIDGGCSNFLSLYISLFYVYLVKVFPLCLSALINELAIYIIATEA